MKNKRFWWIPVVVTIGGLIIALLMLGGSKANDIGCVAGYYGLFACYANEVPGIQEDVAKVKTTVAVHEIRLDKIDEWQSEIKQTMDDNQRELIREIRKRR